MIPENHQVIRTRFRRVVKRGIARADAEIKAAHARVTSAPGERRARRGAIDGPLTRPDASRRSASTVERPRRLASMPRER